jgi:hypothetical protein
MELDTRLVREGTKDTKASEILTHDSATEQFEVLFDTSW